MPWNKTDRSFKTLINKRVTDSDAKFYFNEKGDYTINTHQLELWIDAIPSTAPGATTDIVEYYNTLTLVEDTSVPSKQAWFATSNASTVSAQTDETSRLKNWVSDKYGSTYEIVLYDGSNVQVPPSDGCGWFFDYQTGILTFASTTTTTGGGGSLSSRAPFKIKGYRYIGRTGLDGNIIKNEVRVATTPATSFSGWSYSSELIDTGVTSASFSIDGINLNTTEGLTGDRILIKDWGTLSNNGIYYVERAGDGVSDTWRFKRAPDFNDTADIFPGTMVFVRSGTANARTVWSMSSASFTTLDAGGATGEITFAQFITATPRWSSLTAPVTNLSLGMSTYTTTWNWATGTSTNNLFSLTTDASANGTGALLNIATGSSSTVVPLLVKAGGVTGLTVNASAQVLVGSLTSTRVVYAGASGLLQDSANMTFDGNKLSLATTGSSGGLLIGSDANLYRSASDVLKTDDSFIVGANLSVLNAGTFSLYESGSVNFSSFVAGAQANDLRYTLPTSQPTTNQVLTATAVSGSGPYDITLGWSTPSGGTTIGASVSGGTAGSVLFVGTGPVLAQDNANFYWDDTNNTFGVGTTRTGAISGTNPSVRVKGTGTSSATSSFEVQDSGGTTILFVRNDGRVAIGVNAPSYDLAFGGQAARTIGLERKTSGAGSGLTISAGAAQSGATDTAGGNLTLSSGTATGSGASYVDIYAVNNLGVESSTGDSASALQARFGAGRISFGTTTQTYDLTLASLNIIQPFTYTVGVTDSSAITGNNLTIQAGGGITTANLDGGILTLAAGNSTGSGSSSIIFQTATAGGGGATVRTTSTKMTLTGAGQLQISTTGSSAGILLGGDAQIYRSAADTLRTPDSLTVDVNLTVSGTASIGAAGGTTGTINLLGSTSGTVSVLVQAAAGTYNFNLPTTAGTSGYVLTSAGGAGSPMTWTDPGALAVKWNSIANPTGNQSLTMSTYTTTWNWATGTSTNNLFSLTTDASANGTGALLNIATGASSTVVPLLVKAGATTGLTVNASAQVLVGTLTSGRVTYAGASGLLQDSANMTFDGNRLALATTGATGGLLIGGDTTLYRSAADVLKTDDSLWVNSRLTIGEDPATEAATSFRITKYPSTSGSSGMHALVWNSGSYTRSSSESGVICDHYWVTTDNSSVGAYGGNFNMNVQSAKNTGTISNVFGGRFAGVWQAASTAVGDEIGAGTFVLSSSSATANITNAYGVRIETALTSGFNTTSLYGAYIKGPSAATGTITSYYGTYIASPSSATITNHYGIYMEDLGIGTNRYALYFAGTSGTARQGITWNGDTNLYRSAADTLKTDDSLVVAGGSGLTVSGGQILSTYGTFPQIYVNSSAHAAIYLNRALAVSHTTQFRFLTAGIEKWRFGSTATNEDLYYTYFNGSSWIDAMRLVHNTGQVILPVTGSTGGLLIGGDANLYRSAADTLKTDDAFVSGSTITGASSLTLGAAGGTTGSILLKGTTSGTVTLTVAAAAGSWSMTLPTGGGTSGYVLSTNGSGTTSWSAPGIPWTEVTGTSTSASAYNGYIANNVALVTITLPTPSVGAVVEIVGSGAGGWKAQCASGHTIRMGTTVSASTGYAASTNQYDCIQIIGISATAWLIRSAVGTIDIV